MSRVRRVPLVLALLLSLALSGCGGEDAQPSSVTWRNVTIDLPEGWYRNEETETHLTIANVDLRPGESDEEFVAPEEGVVSMAFTYEPATLPDDWRRFVAEQDATLEADTRLTLDGEIPATQLVFSYVTNDIPTREMVVLVPSRSIVVLSQPIPGPGDEEGPEVFLAHIDTFLQVLETADFGPPVLE
ncbi:hypothetical protein [Egicoccus halophilus]|uniref:Uncharacterized protein n=1 Tax=Egicoccus halophilus TaxID=1670830 RepID=A0A8J3A7R2_9ACTN|nr:hypothetical protein [Egicoccus halophilus]GGI05935.1 hypothetical protein GCM10011354_16590 [Egicoccus halophilus]